MRWVIEIFVGIVLFPLFLIMGLINGVKDVYRAYHEGIEQGMSQYE